MNNDPKLKLVMVRLLPEKLWIFQRPGYRPILDYEEAWWLEGDNTEEELEHVRGRPVLETEWLYVMHLVEQTLESEEHMNFERELERIVTPAIKTNCWSIRGTQVSATFNQRATAMCKVKGTEIV